jgi:magnesium-protoporphyrin IX monomethyl ester (oxidative) cyclase
MHRIYLVSPYTDKTFNSPHNSLEYIKFYLMDHGYNAEIVDCAYYDPDLEEVVAKFKEDGKPIIGITAYTRERFYAYDLIRKLRKEIPDSLIVVGGRHFSCLTVEALKNLPEIDIVVRGDGEETFKEICDSVYNRISYYDIKGISYNNGERIVNNPDRPNEKNLDRFRCFDKDYLPDPERYPLLPPPKNKIGTGEKLRFITVMATRGCPSSCVFCSLKANKVRFRSIDNVIAEIEDKLEITGSRGVNFKDPSLTLVKGYVKELCEKILERNLNVKWMCYSRVDIDLDLLVLMRKAGLVGVEVALESGSPRVLKSIRKRINVDQFERFCKEAYRLGIRVYVFCLLSLPDERIEDVDMTLAVIKRVSRYIYYGGMQTTRILPDAELYSIAKERKVLPDDFDWFKPYTFESESSVSNPFYYSIPVYLEHLSQAEITEKLYEFDEIVKTDFSSFYNFKRTLKANLKSERLRGLTLSDLKRKTGKALVMLKYAYKNRRKHI